MEKNKHTVTIPVSDYSEFLRKYDAFENLLIHLKMLAEFRGLIIKMDVTKKPKSIKTLRSMGNEIPAEIIFDYGKDNEKE